MSNIVLKGEIDYLNFYNVSTGLKTLNPNSEYKLQEIYEVIQNLLESGELDAIISPQEIRLANLDEIEVQLDDNIVEEKNFKLLNKTIFNLIDLENAKEGDIYLFRHYNGEAQIDYETEQDISLDEIEFDYINCSEEFDQYDILRESYLETFCDSIVIDSAKYNGENLEIEDIVFDPQLVKDELYMVKIDIDTNIKVLEKLDIGGNKLFGTDFIVDDFEEN